MHIAGAYGRISSPSIKNYFNGSSMDITTRLIFDVKRGRTTELGAFIDINEPFVEGIISREENGDSSIFSYALDTESAYFTAMRLAATTILVQREPHKDDILDLQDKIEFAEAVNYSIVKQLHEKLGKPFEEVFSAIKYANFLMNYRRLGMKEAFEQTQKEFQITILTKA